MSDQPPLNTYNGQVYESVADDCRGVPNDSFLPFGAIPSKKSTSGLRIGRNLVDSNPVPDSSIHEEPGMNTYKYMIGVEASGDLPNTIRNRIRTEKPGSDTHPKYPSTPVSSRGQDSFIFTDNLLKSFAYNKNFAEKNFNEQGEKEDKGFPFEEESWDSPYYNFSIPYTEDCTTTRKLSDDSYGLSDVRTALKAPLLHDSLLFGFRVMVFAVFPAFILVEHPGTESYFMVGLLIPTMAAALSMPNIGAQLKACFMLCQAALFLAAFGSFVEYTNMVNHPVPWWLCMFLVCFLVNLCGDLPSKRLIMVFSVMIMEIQDKIKPTLEDHFPLQFAKDFVLSGWFALVAAILPYPIFACKLADEQMNSLHALYAAALGNAVKGFWAPVLLDAEVAVSLIPFTKIRTTGDSLGELMGLASYEPVEDGLKNIYRGKRLQVLTRIRWYLYSLSAGSTLNNEVRKLYFGEVHSPELQKTVDTIQKIALKTSGEAISVILALGKAITPEEILKIDFGSLDELAQELEDTVNNERDRTLLAQKFSRREANHLLRLFAYHSGLCKLCREVIEIESWAMKDDRSKYPSFIKRAIEFTFGDYWRNFWIELPRRICLSTPRDVRLVKDSVRYALGLVVVVAFTRTVTSGEEGKYSYYFGMAILARIAQQTASETVQIGLMRICGLAFGSSFGYIISVITPDLWYEGLLLIGLGFLGASLSRHPVYTNVGQYAVITTVAGLFQARTSPLYLLSRISANVVAFALYLVICVIIFPVDPAVMTFNYQSQILKEVSDMTQCLVTLGCCPITTRGEEGAQLIKKADAIMAKLRVDLVQALSWSTKAGAEPIIRGDNFPSEAFSILFLRLAEMASLQEAILESMRDLHKTRSKPVSPIVFAIFELIRPFLIDIGKIIQRYCQLLIDSCDMPRDWSLEKTSGQLWRARLALISFRSVTGNIQRCFVAAIAPGSPVAQFNPKDLYEKNAKEDSNLSNEDPSMRCSFASFMPGVQEAVIASRVERRDFCIFESIVVRFMLLISAMTASFDSAIRTHQYQLSRL